ncbi:type II toxin-antitoxin system RelB/DinJ family antitoxin [Methylotenera sp.]|uniref:type II toxin-antitoxin system RelB/DinJ family antitoxin n=1 Tax=Methylotenera sp. TaxID=2051956 RepID=UPI0025DAA32E|nr:type II toxin-antitoxin system RelB/DinJ family antitoxin [Methylotenera sp.]
MSSTSMVHVRVDEEIKAEATETLALMGLSISDAVRVFLTRVVVEKQLPFPLKVPNPETHAAMMEADVIASRNKARFANVDELLNDLKKNSGK